MSGHLETFLEGVRATDRQLPRHVEQEMRAYLECGILQYGFLRVRCESCTRRSRYREYLDQDGVATKTP